MRGNITVLVKVSIIISRYRYDTNTLSITNSISALGIIARPATPWVSRVDPLKRLAIKKPPPRD